MPHSDTSIAIQQAITYRLRNSLVVNSTELLYTLRYISLVQIRIGSLTAK